MKYQTIPFEGELTPEQKVNLEEWIAALRSGDYQQGTGKLMKSTLVGDLFCCLGVCSKMDEKVKLDEGHFQYPDSDLEQDIYPDAAWFKSKFGFDYNSNVSYSMINNDYFNLAAMNDRGVSFNAIADAIQACFLDRKVIEIEF